MNISTSRLRRFRQAVLAIALAASVLALGYYLLDYLPPQMASQIRGDVQARLEVFNAARATGAQIFLGVGMVAGLVLTWRRLQATARQAESAEISVPLVGRGR